MKTEFILVTILIIGCGQQSNNGQSSTLNEFNAFLGHEKSIAFDKLIESFDTFVKTNYPEQQSQSDRIKIFLEQLSSEYIIDSSWIFQTSKNKEIIDLIENSGLRKEIWIYQYEDYESIYDIFELIADNKPDTTYKTIISAKDYSTTDEILSTQTTVDSVEFSERDKEIYEKYMNQLSFNIFGKYLYGLAKFNRTNNYIQEYVKVKIAAGDIAYEIISDSLLGHATNYDEPFIKRMIATEIYYDLIKWDIQRKKFE